MNEYLLILLFFLIALVYSSVGFGGGSSYLALLAVSGFSYLLIKPTALICNIIVVTGGTYIFHKEGLLDWRKSLPIMATSIPMAFLGGYYKLQESTFFIILGLSLIVASFFLWYVPRQVTKVRSENLMLSAGLGAGIGFLSGLVSIGGGIFLAPVLHIINWDDPRKIAAVASLFILVNSISGLLGQFTANAAFDYAFILPLMLAVLLGGQLGSRLGAKKLNPVWIKRITAVLILMAGANILKDHLFTTL
jgi:uncharacterized protein